MRMDQRQITIVRESSKQATSFLARVLCLGLQQLLLLLAVQSVGGRSCERHWQEMMSVNLHPKMRGAASASHQLHVMKVSLLREPVHSTFHASSRQATSFHARVQEKMCPRQVLAEPSVSLAELPVVVAGLPAPVAGLPVVIFEQLFSRQVQSCADLDLHC